ncbi:hypothetical protein [Rhodoferax saidenbachensis]|uniref:SCP2 domain-containing protein n=1 Tax=Rhodoferax saidenbachensis TaxID=1484693 RepID=A0ABU1ZQF6_9BURK|nr:hypothetical protein [Rhodoferax saidenbachensis]MDR7307783.1 hypothetical protein [Rhodoferax saidenbachensis]
MLDLDALINTGVSASEKMDKLSREFEEFAVRAHEVLTGKAFQIRDIEVKLDLEPGRFSARLRDGPVVQFVLTVGIDAQGATRGYVNAYMRNEFSVDPFKHLGMFSFNADGEMEERDKEGNLLEIGGGSHAAGLVLRYLIASLQP